MNNPFDIFKKQESKAVPIISPLFEVTRDGINKAYIPKFLYKPPFGYPRYANLPYIRYLAQTPYVEMCIVTILDELASIPWDIVIEEGFEDKYKDEKGEIIESKQKEIKHIKDFFLNPNTNYESFEDVFIRRAGRDLLELNSGVLNKVFNLNEEMVEIVARDGATFTKNPDIHGMFTDRKDLILPTFQQENLSPNPAEVTNPYASMGDNTMRESAAYFQYGWISGPQPIPFGKREIVWLEKNPRTDDHYGFSPIQILAKSIQTLMFMIESDLDYYNDNNIPKGILWMDTADSDELDAFRIQWQQAQMKKDEFGTWKKMMHKLPISNIKPEFVRLEFSSQEMELIEKQRWYTKLVWGCFGVTATELGYTEDSQGQSNQIVQSKVFRKKAILPILRLLEQRLNNQVVTEFEYEHLKFKFLLFDVDEEKNKAELYERQIKNGIKTVNEVRQKEGDDPVEWGDDPPKDWQQSDTSFNFSNNPNQNPQENQEENNPKEPNEPPKKKEEKALDTQDNPLILKEGEVPNTAKFSKAIKHILRLNERKIKGILENELRANKIAQIKDLDNVIKQIKNLLSFDGLKLITNEVIKYQFLKGWDKAEKNLDKNFLVNQEALGYIQSYTFDNIKGMTEEITEDLRQELQRGFMEGEGIDKIKSRVSKIFDVGENRAEMISRTESNRASNQGSLLAYKESGIKVKKKWNAHIDDRTSGVCKRLDGQVVGVNENFKDKTSNWEGQAPPAHCMCRSSLTYIIDENE